MRFPLALSAVSLLTLGCLTLGCEEDKPTTSSSPQVKTSETKADPEPEPPKPAGPPAFEVDEISAKVGFSRALLDKPDGRANLEKELAEAKQYIAGKTVAVTADRKAKLEWMEIYFEELFEAGAEAISVTTETRAEYPKQVTFVSEQSQQGAPKCSVVATIMEDRSTAVWRLSGGVASRRDKGMAGPDLTMTQETLERIAKGCKESSTVFVSAAKPIEWGLVYDLAASTLKLKEPKFEKRVLLRQTPTPGHPVEFKAEASAE